MKFYKLFLFLIIGFLIHSCSTVNVSTDYDREVDFNQYKTFAFYTEGLNKLKMNDLDKRRIKTAIESNLKAKGLQPSSESSADLLISLSASNRKKVDINNSMNPWVYSPFWTAGPQYNVREYKEGTLIIDLVDNKKNILVWQGTGEGLNVSDISRKAEAIPEAVKEILENFPPKKK